MFNLPENLTVKCDILAAMFYDSIICVYHVHILYILVVHVLLDGIRK
jgi:hypothetical protein